MWMQSISLIKDMFTEYNKLIKSMDEAYNADSSKGYEPHYR